MDLRSILSNDSSAQKQPLRLHTPQSSFDSRTEQQRPYDGYVDRATPIPSSSHSIDSRSADQAATSMSSHRTHSLPPRRLAEGASVYTQSPGAQSQHYVQRDGSTPYSAHPTALHPFTRADDTEFCSPISSSAGIWKFAFLPATWHRATFISPRRTESPQWSPSNGSPSDVTTSACQSDTATPLGPPPNYPRQSPYSARPSSQGYDHYRRGSIGSVGSTQSREYGSLSQLEPLRAGSIQRNYSGTSEDAQRQREREH